MMCTSLIPCFPSSLATSNNILSMFILFAWLFGFGFFRKWLDKPCSKAVKLDFLVDFLKVQHRRPNHYQ